MAIYAGKTTLLRRFAAGTMPGFPRHLRTLLVGQELAGTESTALQEVLASDTRAAELRTQQAHLEAMLEEVEGACMASVGLGVSMNSKFKYEYAIYVSTNNQLNYD